MCKREEREVKGRAGKRLRGRTIVLNRGRCNRVGDEVSCRELAGTTINSITHEPSSLWCATPLPHPEVMPPQFNPCGNADGLNHRYKH